MNRTRTAVVAALAAVTLVVAAAAITWWLKPEPSTATVPPAPTVIVTPLTGQPAPPSQPPGTATPGGSSSAADGGSDSAPPVESVPAYPSGEPASKTDAAQRRWMPVAVGFAKRFTTIPKPAKHGGSAKTRWQEALRPYVTADLARQLGTVDLRNVPDGTYAAAEAVDWGEDQVAVQVDYDAGDAGWSLVLDISTQDDGKSWQVNGYDRQELR